MVWHVVDGAKPVGVLIAQLVFESSGDNQRKIPVEGDKLVVCYRGEIGGRGYGLVLSLDHEIVDAVIAFARTFESVERIAFSGVDLENDAGIVKMGSCFSTARLSFYTLRLIS